MEDRAGRPVVESNSKGSAVSARSGRAGAVVEARSGRVSVGAVARAGSLVCGSAGVAARPGFDGDAGTKTADGAAF